MITRLAIAALVLCGDHSPGTVKVPKDAIVTGVDCEQWSAWADANGARVWRNDDGAVIATDTGTRKLKAGDVTYTSWPELYFAIEWNCANEYAVGIGNPFQGEPLPAPATQ